MPRTTKTAVAVTAAAAIRSQAAPAFKLLDDFAMPEFAAKYPWRGMKIGQAALFEGVSAEDGQRIIRAASSTGKRYGMRFATRRFPATAQYPQGALAIKYVGPAKAKGKKAKAKKVTAAAPTAPGTQVPSTGTGG